MRLRVAVTNLAGTPLTFLEPQLRIAEPDIRVLISRNGEEFRRNVLGVLGVVMRPYTACTLRSGGVWQCEMRVLYDAYQPGNLAFPEAGAYWVKVVYPLYFGSERFGPSSVLRQETEVVRLSIRDPEGEDVHLWNDPVKRHTLEQIRAALGVPDLALYSIPEEKYYEIPVGGTAADGVEDLFPEDGRLDRTASPMPQAQPEPALVYAFRSLEVAMYGAPRTRGVLLRLAPELAGKYQTVGNVRAESVRSFMRNVTPPGVQWVKHGDGYLLAPAPDAPHWRSALSTLCQDLSGVLVMRVLFLALFAAVCFPPELAAAELAAEGGPVRVTLTAAKREYTVGEPIVLDLALENCGRQPVLLWDRIDFLVAALSEDCQDQRMEPVDLGPASSSVLRCGMPPPILEPGAVRRCRFRVLISNYFGVKAADALTKAGKAREIPEHLKRWRLVCGQPGCYAVMARYQLSGNTARPQVVFSNRQVFRVRWPDGESRTVWEKINRWDFLGFLQSPGPWFHEYGVPGEVADLAVELLQTYPNSAYDRSIRTALRDYYAYAWPETANAESQEEKRAKYLEFERRRKIIREVLQIPQWAIYDRQSETFHKADLDARKNLFVDDRRLDRQITLAVRPFVPMEHVIGDVFKTGNLPVTPHFDMRGHAYPGFTEKPSPVAPSLRGKYEMVVPHGGTSITDSVRGWMQRAMPPGTKWVKDGDGYKLVPAPEEQGNKH